MITKNQDALAQALWDTLQSPNESDSNGEIANVVDVLAQVARSGRAIAHAILPAAAASDSDAAGVTVDSLTEAVMGATAGLVQIADAIHDLAQAVRERRGGGL
jgi:hypothetical protein